MSTLSVRGRVAAVAIVSLLSAPAFLLAESPAKTGNAYLGVAVEANQAGQTGVTVRDFSPDSPAAKAGLKEGDRILMAGDKAVKTFEDLKDAVAAHKPGDKLALKFQRDGKEQSVTVTLAKEPARQARRPERSEKAGAFLGVFTQPLNADIKDHLKLKADKGAVVTNVMPESPAAKAGLQELDVITRVGDTAVNSPLDLRQAVEKAGVGKEVTLTVIRGDKTMEIKAQLAEETAPPRVPFNREGRLQGPPEGFGNFQNRMPPFFAGQDKVPALEKKIQDLESRIEQLEKGQGKPAR